MFTNSFLYIKKSKFISNFKTLSLGILFSQLIIFAAMPILTRLYPPEIFASYALFMSLIGIMVHFFTGSYDLAIVTTGKEDDVNYLIALVLCISLFFLLIFSFIIYYFDVPLKTKFNAENLDYLWYFIPLATFFFSIISTLKYYYNRFENYNKINFIFISRSLIFVFFSLFLFFFKNTNVLIISEFISLTVIFFFFIFYFSTYFNFQFKKLFSTSLKYKDFFFKNSFVN